MCAARLSPRRLVRSLTQPLLPVPRWRGTVHRIGLIRRPSRLCVAAHAGCAVHGRVEAGRAVPDGALRPQWRFASCDERDDAAILVSLTRSPALCLIRVYISSFLKSQGALRDEGGRRARGYASPRGKNKPDVQAGCQLASCRSPRTRHVGSDNNLIYLVRARSPPPRIRPSLVERAVHGKQTEQHGRVVSTGSAARRVLQQLRDTHGGADLCQHQRAVSNVWHRDAFQRCGPRSNLARVRSTDPVCLCAVFEELVVRSESIEKEILDEDEDVAASMVPQKKARAVAKETCPSCGNPEMEYFTMQLRSADEGQTVFYECAKCGHTYSTNT